MGSGVQNLTYVECPVGHDVEFVEEELDVGVSTVSLTEQLQVVAGIVQPGLVPMPVKDLVVSRPSALVCEHKTTRICEPVTVLVYHYPCMFSLS